MLQKLKYTKIFFTETRRGKQMKQKGGIKDLMKSLLCFPTFSLRRFVSGFLEFGLFLFLFRDDKRDNLEYTIYLCQILLIICKEKGLQSRVILDIPILKFGNKSLKASKRNVSTYNLVITSPKHFEQDKSNFFSKNSTSKSYYF